MGKIVETGLLSKKFLISILLSCFNFVLMFKGVITPDVGVPLFGTILALYTGMNNADKKINGGTNA